MDYRHRFSGFPMKNPFLPISNAKKTKFSIFPERVQRRKQASKTNSLADQETTGNANKSVNGSIKRTKKWNPKSLTPSFSLIKEDFLSDKALLKLPLINIGKAPNSVARDMIVRKPTRLIDVDIQVESYLDIKVSTWGRDTYGLFDYSSKDTIKNTFKCSESGSIVRTGSICSLSQGSVDSGMPILNISMRSEEFQIQQEGGEGEGMWMAIKYSKEGFELSEGDVLKLGRVKFKVKHISSASDSCPVLMDNSKVVTETSSVEACRICLTASHSEEDPLIAPCKCSGSMGFVHVLCLKEWLKSKVMTRQSNKACSYYWKDISCELCKEDLPSFVEFQGKKHQLVSISYPSKPFVVFEDYRTEHSQSHGIHIITLDNHSSLSIGRAHECDIKLNDISVSRIHATIKFNNHRYVIKDSNSKFGSLVLLKTPVILRHKQRLTVQVSRTLVSFAVKRPWQLCCCKSSIVRPLLATKGTYIKSELSLK